MGRIAAFAAEADLWEKRPSRRPRGGRVKWSKDTSWRIPTGKGSVGAPIAPQPQWVNDPGAGRV